MLSARGEVLLFADADAATKISDLIRLEEALHKDAPKKVEQLLCVFSCTYTHVSVCIHEGFILFYLLLREDIIDLFVVIAV